MLPFLSSLTLAQVVFSSPSIERQLVTQTQEIRTLPGNLNEVLVFNSNSPEVIQGEGILLSTFSPNGKRFPNAHLNQLLKGRFDVFSHHIARPSGSKQTLYQGIIVYNPTPKTVTIRVLQAASYLTSPDAPFIELPAKVEDPYGRVFSGPGSRLMGDILRGVHQREFPMQIVIPPQETRMLFSLPINPSNARSTFMRLQSNGEVYMANLAMYAIPETPLIASKNQDSLPITPTTFRQPTLAEWRELLLNGRLVQPRDLPPTPPEQITLSNKIFGRVAGISVGSEWIAKLVDRSGVSHLSIPKKGQAFSYPLSTLNTGTHGTRQIQSAPMLVRYPDTSFRAHGNYAVHYNLTFPLLNHTSQRQTVTISLQTPFKEDRYADRLFFANPPQGQVFFRGTVRVTYRDDEGQSQERYFHLVQRQGQQGEPLVTLNMLPGDRRDVNLDFLYPPDATPPQVITIETQQLFYGRSR